MTEPTPYPLALSPLRELALDLRWTWSHEADALWARIDPDLWEQSHNPWTLLRNIQPGRLDRLANDERFVADLQDLIEKREAYRKRQTWFELAHGSGALGGVAFFSMEFGLGSALPLYAGGLGVLAGDFLKAASDLGVPVVGVGLLYEEGYFRQVLDARGEQREVYAFNDPAAMPIEPALVDGAWLHVALDLPGRKLHLRVWRARVGRVTLYLLDSNHPLNGPSDQGVTGALYGGDSETRLLQELALGVGGWRVLETFGHAVEICHINEGHAAFAAIERARRLAERSDLTFDQALWATRAGNVFTTHTPVATGFDQFDPDLVSRYLPGILNLPDEKRPTTRQVLGLGRADPDDDAEPFNTAYLAMRASAASFAVSLTHQEVSRGIFEPLFPRWPQREAPIGQVTNGVHTPSWDSAVADGLWTEACGKERWRDRTDELFDRITCVTDEQIWSMRDQSRADLVGHVRRRLASHLFARGLGAEGAGTAQSVFDANVLTLGFARRFTDYKRPNLLLYDLERLRRIVLNEQRPVQIVVAGKAHPADAEGKAMIREWIAIARDPEWRRRIVFLEDYDLGLAQELVQGVDVWINTPRRPWEACGTSGMKVLVNGGLNCSVLDGWWAQAYQPGLGWSIVNGPGEGPEVDVAEAHHTYDLIEREIAPEFYDRDPSGIPRAWVARIRRSMAALTSEFSCVRMAGEYLDKAYLPAAAALRRREADGCAVAKDLAAWSDRLTRAWRSLHVAAPTIARTDAGWRFAVPVLLGEIAPDDVRVELYAEPDGEGPHIFPLERGAAVAGAANGFIFTGEAPGARPADHFTVRVVPCRETVAVPSELALIGWQR